MIFAPQRTTRLLAVLFASCILATPGQADQPQRVVLKDGSEIVATLRSVQGGVYSFESASLGTIHIEKQRVLRIEALEAPAATGSPLAPGPEMHDLQTQILSDPALIGALMELQGSPAMQALLQDPEILRAAARGDVETLRNNPKMQRLMADPDIQRITRQLAPANPAPSKQ